MQISKVSFMNFQAKKITPKEVKKAVNPMEEFIHNEKGMYEFYPPRASMGTPNKPEVNTYAQQYADTKKAMENMEKPKAKDVAENYFTPFAPTGEQV